MIFKVGEGERVVSVARLPEVADENGDGAAEDSADDQTTDDQRTDDGRPDRYGGPMIQPRVGIYPGTFDPITNGQLDISCAR